DADAEGELAHAEGLTQAAALASEHDALEDLDARAVALDDVHVHLDGVAGAEVRHVLERGRVDRIQFLHGVPSRACLGSRACVVAVVPRSGRVGRWSPLMVAPPGQSDGRRTGPPLSLSHPLPGWEILRVERALHH